MNIVVNDRRASIMSTDNRDSDYNKENRGGQLWTGLRDDPVKAFILIIALFALCIVVFLGVGSVATQNYGSVLYCRRCGQGYYSISRQDYCTVCGTRHSDDDIVVHKPYCLNCGKLEGKYYNVYCEKCGGLITHDAEVKLSEIANPVVRFFVKHRGIVQ